MKKVKAAWALYRQNPIGLVGLGIMLFFISLALFSEFIAPDPMNTANWYNEDAFLPPSWSNFVDPEAHTYGILGTDHVGRDVLSQVIWGSRVSLIVGFFAAALTLVIGLFVGLISGYLGGKVDTGISRMIDLILTLPVLPLMVVLVATIGAGMWIIIAVIGLIWWTWTARVIRSQVLTIKERTYIEVARALGANNRHIISYHILPNVLPLLFANATTMISFSILAEAGVSFIGLGDPSKMSWGLMLFNAFQFSAFIQFAWWVIIPPGLAIALVVLAVFFIGQSIEKILRF